VVVERERAGAGFMGSPEARSGRKPIGSESAERAVAQEVSAAELVAGQRIGNSASLRIGAKKITRSVSSCLSL